MGAFSLIKPVEAVDLIFDARITLAPSLPGTGRISKLVNCETNPPANGLIVVVEPPFTSKATPLGALIAEIPSSKSNSLSTEKTAVVAEFTVTGPWNRIWSAAK